MAHLGFELFFELFLECNDLLLFESEPLTSILPILSLLERSDCQAIKLISSLDLDLKQSDIPFKLRVSGDLL